MFIIRDEIGDKTYRFENAVRCVHPGYDYTFFDSESKLVGRWIPKPGWIIEVVAL